MSKKNSPRKVVTTNKKKDAAGPSKKRKATPTVSKRRTGTAPTVKEELVFGKTNYMLMAAGAGLILLGFLLMSGGAMPDPDTWDPNIIYSTRRTLLAPIVILAGLGLEIYAIFKR